MMQNIVTVIHEKKDQEATFVFAVAVLFALNRIDNARYSIHTRDRYKVFHERITPDLNLVKLPVVFNFLRRLNCPPKQLGSKCLEQTP